MSENYLSAKLKCSDLGIQSRKMLLSAKKLELSFGIRYFEKVSAQLKRECLFCSKTALGDETERKG